MGSKSLIKLLENWKDYYCIGGYSFENHLSELEKQIIQWAIERLPEKREIIKGDSWSHENTVSFGWNQCVDQMRKNLEGDT